MTRGYCWRIFVLVVPLFVACGGGSSPSAPSASSTPSLPKANIIQTTEPGTNNSSKMSYYNLIVWGKNSGSGCARNVQYELIKYAGGDGTFATRGAALRTYTGSHSGTVHPGDTFEIRKGGGHLSYSQTGYIYPEGGWHIRLTFTWTDVACP